MKHKSLLIFIAIISVGAGLLYFDTSKKQNEDVDTTPEVAPENAFVVTLTPDGYEPADFTIAVGTAVTFKSATGKPHWPASNLHPSHEIYSEFDPLQPVDPDKSWTFIFTKEGSWNFHDHMRAYYTGTVHVVPENE